MPKKTKAITDQSTVITEEAEQGQEVQELSRKEIIIQMQMNAEAEIERVVGDRRGLEQLIEDKQAQIKILQAQMEAAYDFYQRALQAEADTAAMVTRENARLGIARGTPAEQEREAILQSLIAALDSAKKSAEEAEKARDEAQKRAGVVTVLREEISEAHSKLADLAQDQVEMEAVRAEQFMAQGISIRDELKDAIEAAAQRYEEALKAQREAEIEMEQLRRSIGDKLYQWRDLRKDLQASHGSEAPDAMTPAEKIVASHIAHLRCIAENGHDIHRRPIMERRTFCALLDLNPNMMDHLLSPNSSYQKRVSYDWGREKTVLTNDRIEVAENLLEQERRHRRSNW